MESNENNINRDSEEGAVLVLFAMILLPLMFLASIVLDVGRQAYINTQLAYACDAASIAAARYTITDAVTNGTKFFYANYPKTINNLNVTPVVTVAADQTSVSVKATSQMPTYFSGMIGIKNLPVYCSATVSRAVVNNQVALVLDVTGSMAENNKIGGLRTAATQLIDILFQGQQTLPNMAVSIVPYVATVNVGNNYSSWVADPATIALFPSKAPWQGCVGVVDTGATMDTDAPPSATRKWPVYYTNSTFGVSGIASPGDNDWSKNADGSVKIINAISGVTIGPNRSCGPAILPLSNSSTALKAKISTLQPVNGGGTFGNLGLVWGWNTISPRWTGQWQSTIQPTPYGGNNLKSIVIVTDGENNWYNQPGYNPNGDPTAYGFAASSNRLSTNLLGTTQISQSRSMIDNRLLSLCTSIKNSGIQIFTVTFQVSDAQAKTIYQQCATKPEWAFQAETSKDLYNQFSQIANQIGSVTIVK